MSNFNSSLALYAILSGIEEDLRELIRLHLGGQKEARELLGEDLWHNCLNRLKRDIGFADEHISLEDILIYLNFSDSYHLLNSHSRLVPKPIAHYIKKITPTLEKLLPIRNKVAHSRPLDFEDFPRAMDIAREFEKNQEILWTNLKMTLQRLREDPSFVLELKIPTFQVNAADQKHNLPVPDFDDTGFLGRKKQVEQIIKLCCGPFPVVTIVGEGGLGKTAIAQKVAYDILDMPSCPFEAIVWTSSKTTQLTPSEIVNIEGAICDSLGMFRYVADYLAPQGVGDPFEEVLKYLTEFPILLILDNLETVLDDRIRYFLERMPMRSKVLITSRIGLGNIEYRYKLEPMESHETLQLIRAIARSRGVDELVKINNAQLSAYCKRMGNSPGFIKWFVTAVQAGRRPEEILDQPDMYLEFCMSNVYKFLSEESRKILRSMLYMPGPHSQARLAYLNEIDAIDLQRELFELWRTNMVTMTPISSGSSYESKYDVSNLAREYLSKHHPLAPEESDRLKTRWRRMKASGEEVQKKQGSNPYSHFSFTLKSNDDLIVVRYLMNALNEARLKNFVEAQNWIAKARSLAPGYFEVHRVQALVHEWRGNIAGARDAYEAAIGLSFDCAPLRKWYGDFLMEYMDDAEGALEQFMEAASLDPLDLELQLSISRTNISLENFDDALDVINSLLMRGDSSEWVRRKVYSLHLQLYQNKAEHLCAQNDYLGSLECLELMRNEFQKYPVSLVDSRMKEILRKTAKVAENCSYSMDDKEIVKQANLLADWLYTKSEAHNAGVPLILGNPQNPLNIN